MGGVLVGCDGVWQGFRGGCCRRRLLTYSGHSSIPFECTQIKNTKMELEVALEERQEKLRKLRKFIVRFASRAFDECVLLSSFDSSDAMTTFVGAFSPSKLSLPFIFTRATASCSAAAQGAT